MKKQERGKVSAIRLYMAFAAMGFRSAMQYRLSFVLTTVGQFIGAFGAFLCVQFLYGRFHTVDGFGYHESLICFATVLMAFSIAECFARGLDTFQHILSNGEFDRILVRPRSAIFQAVTSRFEFTRLGRLLQATIVFAWALPRSGIVFTADRILCLLLMIAGGVCCFVGLFTVYAGICFFTTEGLEVMNIFTDGAREYGRYPVAIYGKEILALSTYVIPYALWQYYPLLYLTGRTDDLLYLFLPILSLLFLIPCFLLWKLGIRHYRSTGS